MRETFHWIKKGGGLYLVIDNAGDHVTGNEIRQYTQILEEKHRDYLESNNISRNQFSLLKILDDNPKFCSKSVQWKAVHT